MPFIHTALVFGVALGAVPILIHLLTRRRHKVVRWGAMKYLLAAIEESSRRVQIEDLILLALRVLTIVLLALAVARPLWSRLGGGQPPSEPQLAVVLLDNSPSMSADRGGVSRWDLARDWARQLLADLPANSEVAIIPLADSPERMADRAEPISQIDVARGIINEMTLSARRADPAAALRAAAKAIAASSRRNRCVYVLSDFQAEDWKPTAGTVGDDLRALLADANTHLVAVQCSDGRTDNCAIGELERAWRIVKVDTPAKVFGTIRRHGDQPGGRDLSATLAVDGAKAESRSARVEAGKPQRVDFVATLSKEGDHRLELRTTPDLCPAGNVRYLAVEARDEVRVLCVDGDPHPDEEFRSETFFLRVALSPQAGAAAMLPITTKVTTVEQLGQEDLKNYDLVVLANVGRIEPARAGAMANYVAGGRAVLIFLGDQVEPDSYNRTLFSPDGLLPMHLGRAVDGPGAGGAGDGARGGDKWPPTAGGFAVELASLSGPIMSYFKDEASRGGLDLARMDRAFQIDLATAPKNVQVHARLGSAGGSNLTDAHAHDFPLLITRDGGHGRVACVNTSADADWGNLVAQPGAFVSLVQRLVVWLLEPESRCQNLLPGQPWRLRLPLSAINTSVTVILPNQKTVVDKPVRAGDGCAFEFRDTDQAGFYQAAWSDGPQAEHRLFAVNIEPVETDLATIEPEALKALAAPAGGRPAASGAAGAGDIRWLDVVSKEGKLQSPRDEAELWRYFLLAALAVLIAETYLGWRFSGGKSSVAGARPRTT